MSPVHGTHHEILNSREGDTSVLLHFHMQSKDGVRCFTDGCTGAVKLALELQIDMGTEIFRRELLRLPEEPKRAAPAAPQAEPKKARKQKGAHKAPAADAGAPWPHVNMLVEYSVQSAYTTLFATCKCREPDEFAP